MKDRLSRPIVASYKKMPRLNHSQKRVALSFPNKIDPLFCTFYKPIADYINKVGFCIFLHSKDINVYDLHFGRNKEVWIFHPDDNPTYLEIRLARAFLRHKAIKVQIQCFPVEKKYYD
jgi:hypothetical protein